MNFSYSVILILHRHAINLTIMLVEMNSSDRKISGEISWAARISVRMGTLRLTGQLEPPGRASLDPDPFRNLQKIFRSAKKEC